MSNGMHDDSCVVECVQDAIHAVNHLPQIDRGLIRLERLTVPRREISKRADSLA